MKLAFASIAASGVLALAALAGPASGPQVGGGVDAFQVVDVSGPAKGRQLCYV